MKSILHAIVGDENNGVKCHCMQELMDAVSEYGDEISYYDWSAGFSKRLELRNGQLYIRGKDIPVTFRADTV